MLNKRKNRLRKQAINEINMVPFIDVMLVLLIIFMVTAPLITPSMIDLPSIGNANKQPTKIIQIIVKANDDLTVKFEQKEQQVAADNLIATIKLIYPDIIQADQQEAAIVISADKSVQYDAVIKVMDKLQQANFKRIGLSVKLNQA